MSQINKIATVMMMMGMLVSATHAEPVMLDVRSRLGLFGDKDELFFEASVTDDGVTRIEYYTRGDALSSMVENSSPYVGIWPEGIGWTKMTVRRSGKTGDIVHVDTFNPFGTMDRVQGIEVGVDYLPPQDESPYQLVIALPFGTSEQQGGYLLEFFVETIPEPIVGDFNFDDMVDFSDFAILSQNFGRDDNNRGRTRWDFGDANLNDNIDFADFLLLSAHFGESRVAAVSVPEPTSFGWGWILAAGLWWWRKDRQCFRLKGSAGVRPCIRCSGW